MVLGEARADTEIVQALAGRIPGMRGVFAGPAAQRPPGRVAGRQPDLGQPPLQGPRGAARHRRLSRRASGRAGGAGARHGGHWSDVSTDSVPRQEPARPCPALALYALVVCVLAVAAAVVSFVQGSLLGIVWVLLAGLSSNMAWYYVRRARQRARRRRPVASRRLTEAQNSFGRPARSGRTPGRSTSPSVVDAQRRAGSRRPASKNTPVDLRDPQEREDRQQPERRERLHLAPDACATARARSRRSRPGPAPAGSSGSRR